MKSIKSQYEQIKKDIEYININYGISYDYCGSWCNCEKFDKLLENPTYETALEIRITYIEKIFRDGYDDERNYRRELPVSDDKILEEIKYRWIA